MLSIDIHKTFKNKKESISVSCKGSFVRGEVTALFGKSGSGKTSVLRMIAGLDKPDKGTISFDNEFWFDEHNNVPLKNRSVGMVFQDFNLFKNMSVLDNLEYAADGVLPNSIEKLCNDLGVTELFQRYPNELSKGQQQKVAILRSMCVQSNILLLDEPFSALDDDSILELMEVVDKLLEELVPIVILVTHRRDVILRMATSVIMLDPNEQGNPDKLLKKVF